MAAEQVVRGWRGGNPWWRHHFGFGWSQEIHDQVRASQISPAVVGQEGHWPSLHGLWHASVNAEERSENTSDVEGTEIKKNPKNCTGLTGIAPVVQQPGAQLLPGRPRLHLGRQLFVWVKTRAHTVRPTAETYRFHSKVWDGRSHRWMCSHPAAWCPSSGWWSTPAGWGGRRGQPEMGAAGRSAACVGTESGTPPGRGQTRTCRGDAAQCPVMSN